MSTAAAQVVTRFQKRLDDGVRHHRALLHAVHDHKRQAALESLLAEQFAFTTTVLWEVFFSNLIKAYVADDPSTFLSGLEARLHESVKTKFGVTAAKHTILSPPSTIPPHKVAEWIDPKDWNISVTSAERLATKANQLLPALAAKRFTLSADDAALFDFTVALRNYLAHRSEGSRREFKSAVLSLGGLNAELNGPAAKLDVYLKATVAAGDTRVVALAHKLRAFASTFA